MQGADAICRKRTVDPCEAQATRTHASNRRVDKLPVLFFVLARRYRIGLVG
jgi:hypothetical protein